MQKIFATILLLGSTVAAFAQGTVYFSNGGLNKVSMGFYGDPPFVWSAVPTTPGLINYGLFYGTGATEPATLTFLGSISGVNSATSAGLIVNQAGDPVTALQIPGTTPGETDVWVQVAGWSASFGTDWAAAKAESLTPLYIFFGQTAIINAAGLGPSSGPGVMIWQTAAGTNPNKFPGGGFVLRSCLCPEPSTMTLFGLGAVAALVVRRGKYRFKQ